MACHKYGDYGNLARDCTLKETTLVDSVVTDATIAKRKGTLLENAIILPQCDEEKRGAIGYMVFSLRMKGYFAQGNFDSVLNLFFQLSLFSLFEC